MSQGIFRQSALERLSSPERLDEMIRITTPRAWLALGGLLAIVAAVALWAVLGSVTTTVAGTGVVVPAGGLSVVATPSGGVVRSVTAVPGATVRKGQVIALVGSAGAPLALRAPASGTVLTVALAPGAYAPAGTVVAVIQAAGRAPSLEVYVPTAAAAAIRPGMAVQFSPAGFAPQQFGFLLGRVRQVATFPVPYSAVLSLIGSPSLARSLMASAPVAAVDVALTHSPAGTAWSLATSDGILPSAGTTGSASVILRVERPIAFVFGR